MHIKVYVHPHAHTNKRYLSCCNPVNNLTVHLYLSMPIYTEYNTKLVMMFVKK